MPDQDGFDESMRGGDPSFREISGDVDIRTLVDTHRSESFDHTGMEEDINVAFPLERLRTLAQAGEIGSVAQWYYSFMGATPGEQFAETGAQVAKLLKDDGVTAAVLVPI